MSDSMPGGRFCWYDLMTSRPDDAVSFYGSIVGWGTAPWEAGPEPYRMWTRGETPVGGVMETPPDARAAGVPPHWLGYVSTADIDATVARAVELGAEILHGPQEVPEVGRFAVLADPQGAAFAVFEGLPGHGDAPEGETGPQPGEFSWHELATTDPEAAFDFYSALFGWVETEAMDMGEAGIYQMFGHGGAPVGGIYRKPEATPGPPGWLYYAKVDDVHRASNVVEELGGKVLNGPMEVPGGDWIAQCMDPQGAPFAIHSTPAATEG